jgi:glycosyltransferase involved in cell wall biosynthesis
MRIAMLGTRGVPARYGGFETCVEEVGRRLARRGHEVVVYCRTTRDESRTAPSSYLGMELVHLPAPRKKSLETLAHTGLSVAHLARHRTDVALMFNAANAPFLPVLRARGIPVATHVDGLEWRRAKWGPAGQNYYRRAEALAVRWSDALIADAIGIQDYYRAEFHAEADLISYGAPILSDPMSHRLAELDLEPGGSHLVVSRFEPENHVDVIVDGYARSGANLPLVVVGSAPYADDYTARVHSFGNARTHFLGGVWDQELLDALYANARSYLHGHSVGGTNPSLLRAIGAATATTAFDVDFNREVLGGSGLYFGNAEDVAKLVLEVEQHPEATDRRAAQALTRARRYDWDDVAERYEELCCALPERRALHRTGSV